MTKKTNKVSVNKWESLVENTPVTVKVPNSDIEITITPTISLADMMALVETVVMTCWDEDNHTYTPEVKEFMFRASVIEYYTNISRPSNTQKLYELVYATPVYDFVSEHINNTQICNIRAAINGKLDHKLQVTESEAAIRTGNVVRTLEDISSKLADVFSGISKDELSEFGKQFTKIANNFSEEKLAKAVLALHKDNQSAEE